MVSILDGTYTVCKGFKTYNIHVRNSAAQVSGTQKMGQVAVKISTPRLAEGIEYCTRTVVP